MKIWDVEIVALGVLQVPKAFFSGLKTHYTQGPVRAYHTYEHAIDVLTEAIIVHFHTPWEKPREVLAAALYHDAIYVPGAKDNEDLSAELAVEELTEHGFEAELDLQHVARLIEVTALHFKKGEKFTEDEGRFLDCDIAGFGSPYEVFEARNGDIDTEFYAAAARSSGALTQEKLYGRRAAWLTNVLKHEFIFHSERGRALYEERARENIKRIIEERYSQG